MYKKSKNRHWKKYCVVDGQTPCLANSVDLRSRNNENLASKLFIYWQQQDKAISIGETPDLITMSISNETAKADEQETNKKSTVDDDPAARNGQIDRVVVEEEEEEEDDDEIIDNDQLIDYKEMVDDLGIFPVRC